MSNELTSELEDIMFRNIVKYRSFSVGEGVGG
jgi:hypothetical protein